METAGANAVKLFARGSSAGKPIVFTGEPTRLKADVWLHNEGKEDLLLEHATLISPALQRHAERQEVARISVPRVIHARERRLLSVSFDIDSSIPPGSYDAEIRLEAAGGSKNFLAQVVVTQNYQLSVDPGQFVFAAGAARSISGELVVRNKGNIAVEVTPMGECQLKDPERPEPCCSAVEEPKQKEEDEFSSLQITNDTVVVQPGTWMPVRFTVVLPDSLPANAHLRARPRVGNKRFNIDILTSARPSHVTKHRSTKSKYET